MVDMKATLDLMKELNEVIDKDESEIRRFEETLDVLLAIKEVRERQQAQMKDSIKKLCSLVEEDKERLSANPELEQYVAREASVREQITKATEGRAQAQRECHLVQDELAKLNDLQAELAKERETVENNTTKVLPKIRYDLNLYNLICRIRWQYDSGPDDVSGFVCNKGDVKPFSLSTQQSSQFFITNYLWDLIEEGSPVW